MSKYVPFFLGGYSSIMHSASHNLIFFLESHTSADEFFCLFFCFFLLIQTKNSRGISSIFIQDNLMEYFAPTMFCLSIVTTTKLSGEMMSVISLFVRVPLKAKVPSKSLVIQWPPRHAFLHKEDNVTFKSISEFPFI